MFASRADNGMLAFVYRQTQLLMAFRASAVTVCLYVLNAGKEKLDFLLYRSEPFHEPGIFLASGSEILGQVAEYAEPEKNPPDQSQAILKQEIRKQTKDQY